MDYNLSREEAAEILWISTRTLDRRIRKWTLSHQKKWNKVYLAEEEVRHLTNKGQNVEVVYEAKTTKEKKNTHLSTQINQEELISKLSKHMEQNMWQFLEVLSEKDKKLEEKNQIIFALQHKVWELENKLKNTVALPLYQEEKEELILEKENLKIENKVLEEKLKKEKIQNIALIWFLVILIIVLILAL